MKAAVSSESAAFLFGEQLEHHLSIEALVAIVLGEASVLRHRGVTVVTPVRFLNAHDSDHSGDGPQSPLHRNRRTLP